MDYEKKYKNALERAEEIIRYYKEHNRGDEYAIEDLEQIFPELKEDKDEKIRKELKRAIAVALDYSYFDKETADNCIAWLERQGEQNYKIIKGKNYFCVKTHNYAGVEWIKGTKYYASDNYTLVNQGCEYYCPEYSKEEHNNFFKEVEYDGCLEVDKLEPKFKVKYAVGEYNVVDEKDIAGVTFYGIEDEPNHIDYVKADTCEIINAKPKFKTGDWIVWQDKCYKVNYNGCGYELVDQNGLSTTLEYGTIDESAHLWTINEAKDGDVLATSAGAFIYNGNNGGGCCPGCYCGIDTLGNFKTGTEHHWTTKPVFPATKEQHDTLFAKMKEAMYEWDIEKKELKKIEENSFESDIVEKALRKAGYEWSEDAHQLKKIEQKFKVGDWVVDNCGYVWEITENTNLFYDLKGVEGDESLPTIECVDNTFHLWSIEDAKDGDILSNGKMIVIFKHFEEPSYKQHIVAYIGLDTNGDIQITDDTWNLGLDKVKPATKEQRELLFKRMKEKGYEWDVEKKNLF